MNTVEIPSDAWPRALQAFSAAHEPESAPRYKHLVDKEGKWITRHDVWINGGGWTSLPAMLDDEPRYVAFKAYRLGQVWTYERRQKPSGANDYWARSVTHPDVLLADVVKIFHPLLTPEHVFEWYVPVPAR